MKTPLSLMWFRRDLRLEDNAALYHALKDSVRVTAVFVLDTTILGGLPKADRRVEYIADALHTLHADIQRESGGRLGLVVLHGDPSVEIPRFAASVGVKAVYANHDDEPQALGRDATVADALQAIGGNLHSFKDHVIFERQEILTQGGTPYTVFTPYKNAWIKRLAGDAQNFYLKAYPSLDLLRSASMKQATATAHLSSPAPLPQLEDIGFVRTNLKTLGIPAGTAGAEQAWQAFLPRLERYDQTRDFPAVKGVSYLGVHLRFGTLSLRKLARAAYALQLDGNRGASVWLSELIWRDFYHQILANFPHVATGCFKPAYDAIAWEEGTLAQERFAAWCEGRTGYPIVDAAMRQLNQTGYMHNRLRMVAASFLTKDLGVDWRWGEAYFAQHLNDFDLAANNGGWQWSASTGCDAQPYFRIFNPQSQSERFDPQAAFIKRYVPELAHVPVAQLHALGTGRNFTLGYPTPVVDHAQERIRTLARYKAAVNQAAVRADHSLTLGA